MAPAALRDASNGMMTTWGMLAGEWVLLMVTAWYLEQVSLRGRCREACVAWVRDAPGSGDAGQVKAGPSAMRLGLAGVVHAAPCCRCTPAAPATAATHCTSSAGAMADARHLQ